MASEMVKGFASHIQNFSKQPSPYLSSSDMKQNPRLSCPQLQRLQRDSCPEWSLLFKVVQDHSPHKGSSFSMLHSQGEPALGAGKHRARGQHHFSQSWRSLRGVRNFIAVTKSLLFFNFIFTSRWGTRLLQWWLPLGLGGSGIAVLGLHSWFFITSHPSLRESVVTFLPLRYLSPTRCACVCVYLHACVCVCVCVCLHNFITSHSRRRARHGAHSQTTQSVTTSRCAKDRKSDLQLQVPGPLICWPNEEW